jgi:ubiquitin conjugation factor E4 B
MSLILKKRNNEQDNKRNSDAMDTSSTSHEASATASPSSELILRNDTVNSQSQTSSPLSVQQNLQRETNVSAEEMRRRRLARFGGASAPSSQRPATSTSAPPSLSNNMTNNFPPIHPVVTTFSQPPSATEHPASEPINISRRPQLSSSDESGDPMDLEPSPLVVFGHNKKSATMTPPYSAPLLNSPSSPLVSPSSPSFLSHSPSRSHSSSPSPLSTSPLTSAVPIPYEKWEHDTIKSVLQISLEPASESTFIYVAPFLEFLQKQNRTVDLLNRNHVDQILIFLLSSHPNPLPIPPLTYLTQCHFRATEEKRKFVVKTDSKRIDLLTYMQQLLVSYFGIICQNPECFPFYATVPQSQILSEIVSLTQPDTTGRVLFSFEFVEHLIERFESEGLTQIFEPIFEEILTVTRAISLSDKFLVHFTSFYQLIRHKALRQMLLRSPNWIPKRRCTGKEMEVNSILGPFFRMVSFSDDPHIGCNCIPATLRSPVEEQEALSNVREQLHAAQRAALEILHSFLKSGREEREYVLRWLGSVLERNNARSKIQVDPITVASDGFMINITAVLLALCEPFLSHSSSKISFIDPEYFVKSNRINIEEETRLAMSLDEAKNWIEKRKEELNMTKDATSEYHANFVTECFFLTMKSFNLGVLKIFERYANKMRELNEYLARKKYLLETRNKLPLGPQALEYENKLAKLQKKIDNENRKRLCIEAQLLDPSLLHKALKFFDLAAVWLLKLATKDKTIDELIVPLADSPPARYAYLPQYLVENIVDFLISLAQYEKTILDSFQLDDFMSFLVTFIGSPSYIRNPHIRSKLVELLSLLTPKNFGKTLHFNIFERNLLAQKYLMPSLMRLYVEVEHTGLSTQFYDKFNARYYISVVMRYLWKFPIHQEAFQKEAQDQKRFLTYVNMVINDAIFLLDESLGKLAKIRNMQVEMTSPNWSQRPLEETNELEQEYARLERQVRTYLLLAQETMRMFHYLARDVPTYFIKEKQTDMVDRLASMLNYFLLQLAGPKCLDLKVNNPSRYNFDPKWLLKKLVAIYLYFAREPEFSRAVARDVRSYSHDVFVKTAHILQRERLVSEDVLARFNNFVEHVQQIAQREKSIDDLIEEAPAEFLDPILSTLMRDPVILPSSRVTVDRTTIVRHLLSDQTDPFNRSHLTVDMLIPNVELKEKIANWIASKMKQ